MANIREIRNAQKTRGEIGESITNKKTGLQNITKSEETQRALFREFISELRDQDHYKKARDVLKRTSSYEKENGKINHKELIKNNVKNIFKQELIEKNNYKAIGEYMKTIEASGYTFEKDDILEIAEYIMSILEEKLSTLKAVFKQYDQDKEKYNADIKNERRGQTILSRYVYNPQIKNIAYSISDFFITVKGHHNNGLKAQKKDTEEIFNQHIFKFLELISLLGNMETIDFFNTMTDWNNQARSREIYENRLRIAIFKGDLDQVYIARQGGYANSLAKTIYKAGYEHEASELLRKLFNRDNGSRDLTVDEIEALAIHKGREENKENEISKIREIIYKINRLGREDRSKDIIEASDYYIRDDSKKNGKIGKKLMQGSLENIQKETRKLENILQELQSKQKTGVAEIIKLLQSKGNKENK